MTTHKTEGPSSWVTFLGFLVDTDAFQLRLPEEKLSRMRELICAWQGRRNCTRKEMESLLGHLSHAATAVCPGCLFLRQLFALLPHAPKPHHYIRLNLSVKANLAWWSFFSTRVEQSLSPPSRPPVCACVLRCLRFLRLWSSGSEQCLFQCAVAATLGLN